MLVKKDWNIAQSIFVCFCDSVALSKRLMSECYLEMNGKSMSELGISELLPCSR